MSVVAGCGLLIGVLLGLLGAGGSILAVPALVYGAGQPLSSAVPTSLLVVGVSAAAAVVARVRASQVQWRIAAVVGGSGIPAAFAGTAVNRALNPRVVLVGFAVVMVVAAVRMLREQPEAGSACALPDGGVNWRGCLPKAVGTGVAVGFLTGLFGVGGGFLIVPALVLLLGLPMTVAVGTSLLVVAVNSAAGLAAHAGSADIDYGLAAVFTGAAVAGSLLAARVAARLPADRLRRWFAWLVLAVAAFVAVQALVNPGAGA
ncbi:MAG: sulfite exporter TauE/SafE family protein [Sporichthyaceae bacterium]